MCSLIQECLEERCRDVPINEHIFVGDLLAPIYICLKLLPQLCRGSHLTTNALTVCVRGTVFQVLLNRYLICARKAQDGGGVRPRGRLR